ncbi:MAG: FumA C-terminus/TtdB family hydratase beta subunit [Thermodesulfovibrionales bacterium]|nr:FumA C-terminus/TtdB family hydratase beta subunit [Thermodesulfovibrionales bacterium]
MNASKMALPVGEEYVRSLRAGDTVLISGQMATGRDRLHKFLYHESPAKETIPFKLDGSVLYHSGPVIRQVDGGLEVLAAGPTTSGRVEIYEPWVIEHYGIRGVMGKGGMGRKTLEAMMKFGCVYLNTIGGAASYLADRVRAVSGGWMAEEFGMAEAMWIFEVEDFPAIVTMDTRGRSLHEEIEKLSLENLLKLLG